MSDEMVNFPVPLGNGRIAQVKIPHDLTKEEAGQISRVVIALAVPRSVTAALPKAQKTL